MSEIILQPDAAAGKDTYVASSNPTTNYGGATTIQTYWDETDPTRRRGLIEFDLSSIPAGAVISSAILELMVSVNGFSPIVYLYRAITNWIENTVTWNTQPGISDLLISSIPPGPGNWHSFDITIAVQNWFTGIWSNQGMMLKLAETGALVVYAHYYSSDFATSTSRPKLTINYTLIAGTPKGTLMMMGIGR